MTTFEIKLDSAKKAVNFINKMDNIDVNADLQQKNNHIVIDAKDAMGIFCLDLSQVLKLIIYTDNEDTISKVKNIVASLGYEQRAVG